MGLRRREIQCDRFATGGPGAAKPLLLPVTLVGHTRAFGSSLSPMIKSERQFSRFVLVCVSLGFLALILSSGAAAWTVLRAQDHARWVEHTYEVESAASRARVLFERMEVARRGYILTGSPNAMAVVRDAAAAELTTIATLRALTRDNPRQQARLDVFEPLAKRQIAILTASMDLAARDPLEAQRRFVTGDGSVPLINRMRVVTGAILSEEKQLLDARSAAQSHTVRMLFLFLALTAVLLAGVGGFSVLMLFRYTRRLVESRASVERLNAELEDRVLERTRDLSRANEEIQRFAYIVSHDLRSPLVNVMGFTGELEASTRPLSALVARLEAEAPELLDNDAKLAAHEDLPEAIRFIRASTQKMDRLINAILRLSREGKRVLTPERVDLGTLTETIVASLQHRLDEMGATVTVERPMPPIVADRLAIEQMLSNLIENAVKYLKPGRPGRIVISARRERDRIAISVADNGRGIDPRDHERIFDLFRRSGQQDQPGEGIGLAHVRALAYRMGGLVDCRSALDEGATFTLSLPAQPVENQG
jgi:signal transduction histidine kinase